MTAPLRTGPRPLPGRLARPSPPPALPRPAPGASPRGGLPHLRSVLRATAWWAGATVLGIAVVTYLVGPLLAAREQRSLLTAFRADVSSAVGSANDSLLGAAPVVRSIPLGDPVALLQVPRLHLQQVAVEGADPARTRGAPGHLPGTAGLGQPGNAVVTGRQALYGRAFARLDALRSGDQVVVTTAQGPSLYVVESVRHRVRAGGASADPSPDDRLTLLSSAGHLPWSSARETVVVAALRTGPFTPTPQNGRADDQDGRSGDTSVLPLLALCALAYTGATAGATVLYQRWSTLGTYVVTTPALVALLVFLSLAASSLLPASA